MNYNPEEDVEFIKEDLLPEMVYDRCFCEIDSREFVEFRSAEVDPNPEKIRVPFDGVICYKYTAKVTVDFSGIPIIFPVIIKLVPKCVEMSQSFGYFLMEEYLYTKMLKKYNKELFPKCYLSNLGKYGRPVIVLENLLENGYEKLENLSLPEEEMCLRQIGRFHAAGMKLKKDEPAIFREFETNIYVPKIPENKLKDIRENSAGMANKLESNYTESFQNYNITTDNKFQTVCHGNLKYSGLHFKRENNVAVEVKFSDFEFMKISSIGFHLTTFLLLNSNKIEINVEEIDDYIQPYLDEIKQIHPEITAEDVKNEMRKSMNLSYVNTLIIKNIQDN